MNNMPAICVGMGDHYEGPIEDEEWLGIRHTRVPGAPELSKRLITDVMQDIDLAYAQEWKFDHGIMVPLSFLTPRYDLPIVPVNINCQGPPLIPLKRCYEFGRALRRACDRAPERLAVIGTGGISHWPATPDSGKINEPWDREFLKRLPQQRPGGVALIPGRGHLAGCRAGRPGDSNIRRPRRRCGGFHGGAVVLRTDSDLFGRLHYRGDERQQARVVTRE